MINKYIWHDIYEPVLWGLSEDEKELTNMGDYIADMKENEDNPTYSEMAMDYDLWTKHVDPEGIGRAGLNRYLPVNEEEFDEMDVDDKIALITECFGSEEVYLVESIGYWNSNKGEWFMQLIVDGLKYDTETAEHVAELNNWSLPQLRGIGPGDHSYFDADLYRTRNGRWFIAGRGGPSSMFAVSVGNPGSWASTGGSGIIPISKATAQWWLEQVATKEMYKSFTNEALEKWFSIQDA
jgi:hypothetical protein